MSSFIIKSVITFGALSYSHVRVEDVTKELSTKKNRYSNDDLLPFPICQTNQTESAVDKIGNNER